MRLIALTLASVIALGPSAPASDGESEPRSDSESELDRAKRLYDEGRGLFETGAYSEAVDIWTEAYTTVPDRPEYALSKALLIYNIAAAHKKLFDVDQDVAHLRRSRILLKEFEEKIAQLYDDEEEEQAERDKITEKLAELDAQISAAEGDQPIPPAPDAPPAPAGTDKPPPDRSARPLIISGAVLAGVGVAGMAVMGGGLAMGRNANDISDIDDADIEGRRDQFQRGRNGNIMAIVGGAVGGTFLVTGAVLLAIGLTKRKRGGSAFAPTFGPRSAGLSFRTRF